MSNKGDLLFNFFNLHFNCFDDLVFDFCVLVFNCFDLVLQKKELKDHYLFN